MSPTITPTRILYHICFLADLNVKELVKIEGSNYAIKKYKGSVGRNHIFSRLTPAIPGWRSFHGGRGALVACKLLQAANVKGGMSRPPYKLLLFVLSGCWGNSPPPPAPPIHPAQFSMGLDNWQFQYSANAGPLVATGASVSLAGLAVPVKANKIGKREAFFASTGLAQYYGRPDS
jgi:hypothetical protein